MTFAALAADKGVGPPGRVVPERHGNDDVDLVDINLVSWLWSAAQLESGLPRLTIMRRKPSTVGEMSQTRLSDDAQRLGEADVRQFDRPSWMV